MTQYKEIFNSIEATLRKRCSNPSRFDDFKAFENRSLSDDDYFDIMVAIVFYSGFKAGTVTKKMPTIRSHFPEYKTVSNYGDSEVLAIMNDTNMIKNERKIQGCLKNARIFSDIVKQHGSFKSYIESFNAKDSFENLMLFKEEIGYKFDYLGGVTAYHFLTDIGMPVLKPDRVITRIFKRLGLVEDEGQLLKTVIQGRKFALETALPIRYVDIIFVKYGQVGEDTEFGLDNGICMEKNPRCSLCSITKYCSYAEKTSGPDVHRVVESSKA